jgi:hypothetical protein
MNSISNERFTWPQAFAWAFAIVSLLASSVLLAAEGDAEARVTSNAFFAESGRTQAAPNNVANQEQPAIVPGAPRDRSALRSAQSRLAASANSSDSSLASAVVASAPNTDFWFYRTDVELFADDDNDGYFSGIDLLFDADTYYSRAEVYAVIYLSYEGGAWTEYAETDDFVINDSSGDDEYVVVTDLVSGYPTGDYDILIELFDAFNNDFVADIGPESTSELSFLPLEDIARDAPGPIAPPVVVNQQSGGGSADLWTLLAALLFAAGVGIRRRRSLPAPAETRRGPSA